MAKKRMNLDKSTLDNSEKYESLMEKLNCAKLLIKVKLDEFDIFT